MAQRTTDADDPSEEEPTDIALERALVETHARGAR
jgi:hypothetical protein